MRMFLVGMCDIFLILYLTTLGHVDRSLMSDVTIGDYRSLEESARSLQSEIKAGERKLAQLQSSLQENAKLAAQQQRELKERLTSKVKKLEQLEKKRSAELKTLQSELEQQTKDKQKAGAILEERAKELVISNEQVESLKKKEQELIKLKEQQENELRLAKTELNSKTEEQKRLEQKLKQAQSEAQKALEEAEQARKDKEEADKLAREAEEDAKLAREEKALAKQEAEKANEIALQARVSAVSSAQTAKSAQKEAQKAQQLRQRTQKELEAVIQPAEDAYQQSIEERLIELELRWKRKLFLIGSSKREFSFRLLPVKYGNKIVVFAPLNQIAGEEPEDADSFERLEFSIGEHRVSELLVNDQKPRALGIVLKGTNHKITRSNVLEQSANLSSLMPTLLSLRNGSELEFSDRIRNLNDDYFVFKRDRLEELASQRLRFRAEGFRGTRDFGERILPGDQIVDLRGRFLGIALNENRVLRIPTVSNWRVVAFEGRSAKEVVKDLWR